MLASADDVLEALQNIPFPEGVYFDKPVASWRGDAAAQGIEGKVGFGGGNTLKLLTDPKGRSVEISIQVSSTIKSVTNKRAIDRITEHLRVYFGADPG